MKIRKHQPIILLILFSSTLVFAQNRHTRNVSAFSKISFGVPGKLYLKQGSPQKVELEGDKDILEKISVEVEGSRLAIASNDKWYNWHWSNNDKVIVYVTVENIDAIYVSGSGDVIGENKLISNTLDIKVSGSGSVKAEVDVNGNVKANVSGSGNMDLGGKCQSFESNVSGSGRITLSANVSDKADFNVSGSGKIEAKGTAKSVEVSISGSGRVLASNLETDKCDVRISGSGDVEINVKNDLDAQISGSGSVSYKGNPAHLNTSSSGSGSVRKI